MRSIIARANHLAAVEQWNTPIVSSCLRHYISSARKPTDDSQLPDREPTKIAISITAETESDIPGTTSNQTLRSEHLTESIKTRGVACDDSP